MTREASPHNPLRNYQFRVGFYDPPLSAEAASADRGASGGGQLLRQGFGYVAGVKRVSGLNLSVGVSEVWSGGNSLHRYANPDKVTWDPITLEQGLALSRDLEDWALAVLNFIKTGRRPAAALKRNVFIDVWDPYVHGWSPEVATGDAGQAAEPSERQRLRRYMIFKAWISRYQALPQLNAMSNEIALLSVELVHEGWRVESRQVQAGQPRTGSPAEAEG
jgi:phage tail-like protein